MARKKQGRSFADIAAEPTWSEVTRRPSWQTAVLPGRFNRVGTLFDPQGLPLLQRPDPLDEAEARRLTVEGARVAHEVCGCGGATGGCEPVWLDEGDLTRLRRSGTLPMAGNADDPAWIDGWDNENGPVVFLHGTWSWGSVIC